MGSFPLLNSTPRMVRGFPASSVCGWGSNSKRLALGRRVLLDGLPLLVLSPARDAPGISLKKKKDDDDDEEMGEEQ